MGQKASDNVKRWTYQSMAELVDAAQAAIGTKVSGGYDPVADFGGHGLNGVETLDEMYALGRHGWQEALTETLDVAEHAVSKVDAEVTLTAPVPVFDVSGCDVDVQRFLDGEPENMIDYPMVPVVKAGRVITLCASVCYSAAVESEAVVNRGHVLTALALALTRLGYQTEIWADWTVNRTGKAYLVRCLVKSANDVIDPESIMFALAHPAMGRGLMAGVGKSTSSSGIHGMPANPPRDLPEGTLYLTSVMLGIDDIEHPERAVMEYLRKLELVD